MSDSPRLTPKQRELLDALPGTSADVADSLDISPSAVRNRRLAINQKFDGERIKQTPTGEFYDTQADADDADDREELTEREAYIYRSLPASLSVIATDLGVSERVIEAHLDTIAEKGWSLEGDDAGNYIGLDQDHLRSSEHKQTRTRKANRWWQARHDQLVHEFQQLEWPTAEFRPYNGNEDWVTHLTDLHAGDLIRRDDGRVVYETSTIPRVIDYITNQSLALADKHGSTYDAAHLLWAGDFITNEGIYESQYEDLDAWLDEQHDILVAPLMRQLKAFSERFPAVQVVCQVGNHGQHRASGVSRQANADLILYKHIRNNVASVRKYGDGDALENVEFKIGEARAFRNFQMRDGAIKGHLRHGQDRKPQAVTRAGSDEWRGTLMDHQFDVGYLGHHHISGRLPWDGPPVLISGSPKPAGEYVERLGGRTEKTYPDIATAHGVSDDGLTSVFPIDTRHFDPE